MDDRYKPATVPGDYTLPIARSGEPQYACVMRERSGIDAGMLSFGLRDLTHLGDEGQSAVDTIYALYRAACNQTGLRAADNRDAAGADSATAMEGWHAAVDDASELFANARDERFASRASRVVSWIKANRPTPTAVPAGEVVAFRGLDQSGRPIYAGTSAPVALVATDNTHPPAAEVREVDARAAKALLSARSHIGARRPDDEDDAAEVTDERGQPMTYWGGTPTAVPAGEAVAIPFAYVSTEGSESVSCAELVWPRNVRKGPRGAKAAWRDLPPGKLTPLYLHPPAAEVREVSEAMARRLDDYLEGEFDIRIGKQAAHAAMAFALSPPGRAEGES